MTGMPQKSTEGQGEQLVCIGHAISMAKTPHLVWASARFSVTEMTLNHTNPTSINKGPDQQSQFFIIFFFPEEQI